MDSRLHEDDRWAWQVEDGGIELILDPIPVQSFVDRNDIKNEDSKFRDDRKGRKRGSSPLWGRQKRLLRFS